MPRHLALFITCAATCSGSIYAAGYRVWGRGVLVRDAAQIIEKVKTLNEYARSEDKRYRDFFNKRIKNGKWIVAVCEGRTHIFAPSKFAGYASNDISHENKLRTRDGGETNKAILGILGAAIDHGEAKHAELDEAFVAFCKAHHVEPSRHHRPRRYWSVVDPVSSDASNSDPGGDEFSEGKAYLKIHQAVSVNAG